MISSAELDILLKFAELAKRNGLRPSEANATFLIDRDEDHFVLRLSGYPAGEEKAEKYERLLSQVGISEEDSLAAQIGLEYPEIKVSELSELEDIVDRALSLAPRARSR